MIDSLELNFFWIVLSEITESGITSSGTTGYMITWSPSWDNPLN